MLTLSQISNAAKIVANEYPITKMHLFGSYAEGRNTPDSDVDLLVEFDIDSVSLLTLASLKYRLEELLEVEVDVIHAPLEESALIAPERLVEIYAA
ncbi:MAG: nucleotidyltransferase domain-containing protein [Oscillospiraceae bacterium]|nr:nucleotidyltransferase domain-containing protein [Oscillospiraceae bacterium]